MEMIAVAELEEAQVRMLVVDVAADAFESAEKQSLTHHAEVTAQRIHQLHSVFLRIAVQILIICNL